MTWFLLACAYLIAGEITALLALTDDDATANIQWLAYRGSWWLPYAGVALFVIAWPVAVALVLLLARKKH